MSDLKPCPFCGQAAVYAHQFNHVQCSNPNCLSGNFEMRKEQWNKRSVEDSLVSEINRLKTPVEDKCPVCGSYVGDTNYYHITDGKEIEEDVV